MGLTNHPLGLPRNYARGLARRHADVGFILAQLTREYGDRHSIDRAAIEIMRRKFEIGRDAERTRWLIEEKEAIRAEIRLHMTPDEKRAEIRIGCAKLDARRQIERESAARSRRAKFLLTLAAYNDKEIGGHPQTVQEVIAAIAKAFCFLPSQIVSDFRHGPLVRARQVTAYVLVKRGNSYGRVGVWMGRDHSTIIHAVRQFEAKADDFMRAVAGTFIPRIPV